MKAEDSLARSQNTVMHTILKAEADEWLGWAAFPEGLLIIHFLAAGRDAPTVSHDSHALLGASLR